MSSRTTVVSPIADRARAIVVHNPGAAALVRNHRPEANIHIIPHLFDPPPDIDPVSVLEFRRAAGIPFDAYLLGVFGFLRESKRVIHVLDVFTQLRATNPKIALLVAGEFVSSDLERACLPLLSNPGVYRVPYMSEQEFWTAAMALDACINLRVPAAGETSGIAIRMMGIGKTVLVTDAPENGDFPKGSFLPVPQGVAERAALFDYICILATDRVLSGEIGRLASTHIRHEHSVAEVSERYWNLLCKNAGS